MKKTALFLLLAVSSCLSALVEIAPVEHLRFEPPEMHVMPVENWAGHETIREKLTDYHSSRFADPSDARTYIDGRIQSLEALLHAFPERVSQKRDRQLQDQARKKLRYLKALPELEHPWLNRVGKHERLVNEQGGITINPEFWSELVDPLGRPIWQTAIYQDLWAASEIENYFVFLELAEEDPLINKFAQVTWGYPYLRNAEERAPFIVKFQDGKLYQKRELVDTSEDMTYHNGAGVGIYVVGFDGTFYLGSHSKMHHTRFFKGEAVFGAGELKVHEGRVEWISNGSGHYRPTAAQFVDTVRVLGEHLDGLDGIEARVFIEGHYPGLWDGLPLVYFDAADFADNGSAALPIGGDKGLSPLHVAVWMQDLQHSDLLIEQDALNSRTKKGHTPLHFAVCRRSTEWTARLLEAGADLRIRDWSGKSALDYALDIGDKGVLELLLQNADELSSQEQLLLARTGSYDLVKRYVADFEYADEDGNHLIHFAATAKRDSSLLEALVEMQPGAVNVRGETPLHVAAATGCQNNIEILLDVCGIDVRDDNGRTALMRAAASGHAELVEYLLAMQGLETLDQTDFEGRSVLHHAAAGYSADDLKLFLDRYGYTEASDIHGNTPLHYCVEHAGHERYQKVMQLIKYGADTRSLNEDGLAAIHLAAARDKTTARSILVLSDDATLPSADGRLPYEFAAESGQRGLANWLKRFTIKKS